MKKELVLLLQFNDSVTGKPITVEMTEAEFDALVYKIDIMRSKWHNENDDIRRVMTAPNQ
jgi:hypothetical protein